MEPVHARFQSHAPVRVSFCERLAEIDAELVATVQRVAIEGKEPAGNRSTLRIESVRGSVQTRDCTESERGPVGRLARVRARIRCAGVTPAEASRRCAESVLRAVACDDGTVLVRCEFAAADAFAASGLSVAALDGMSLDVALVGDRLRALSIRTSGGDLLHGALTAGDLGLSTSGGRLDVVCHRGSLRAANDGGRILLHRISGKVEARTRHGDIVLRTAVDPLPTGHGLDACSDITLCADNGTVEVDFSGGWRSAGQLVSMEASDSNAIAERRQIGEGDSTAVLVAPRGRVLMTPTRRVSTV
jgi:hypothetical protein